MAKPPLTTASAINADVVLGLGAYYSADRLRRSQAQLTRTARDIRAVTSGRDLLGKLGNYLSADQRKVLQDAASLLESINSSVEHAKERKTRSEAADRKRREQRQKDAKASVSRAFPLPLETQEQRLAVIRLAIQLHHSKVYLSFCNDAEFHAKLRARAVRETLHHINWHRTEMLDALVDAMVWREEQSIEDLLATAVARLEGERAEVLGSAAALETLRVWEQALAFVSDREGLQ